MRAHNWYVHVVIFDEMATLPGFARGYAMGPLESWTRARDIAERWERQHGPNTTEITSHPSAFARANYASP
jgi:hypothetical protein